MLTVGWLLFVFLNGHVEAVIPVDGPLGCIERAQFEVRFQPQVETRCYAALEIEA